MVSFVDVLIHTLEHMLGNFIHDTQAHSDILSFDFGATRFFMILSISSFPLAICYYVTVDMMVIYLPFGAVTHPPTRIHKARPSVLASYSTCNTYSERNETRAYALPS
jgi:hypothetical protein